ncbi:M28 family peptidase [Maribacter polysiphoniae]|uniref:M28 family peptidase n=1 Tax=Maribacter polysiphoniae TaxID=429344 RepID=A0A316DTG1_9FLAO|nr:M28 family peptidase [Maribacter polysiphoniae]MBD1262433.1 M28 family peptidase [Maribacter polysiphoniae]PWK21265.1 peptidase M28-like protein [Maribacter polysiphoniae]
MKNYTLLLAFAFASFLSAQTEIEKVVETVNKSEIEGHIHFLADDVLKGRATGSPELKIAASYLANTLRSYGVKPISDSGDYYQKFEMFRFHLTEEINISLNGINFPEIVAFDIDAIDSEEDAVYLNYGLESDYIGKDVKDKIIIVKAGTPDALELRPALGSRAPKRELAIKNGARGLIEIGAFDEAIWPRFKHAFEERVSLTEGEKEPLPLYLWIQTSQEELDNLGAETLKIKIKSNGIQKAIIQSQNVVGVIAGTDPELKKEYVIYSAHYDHIGIGKPDAKGDSIYNGARDNAIGVTAVLTIAKNLAKYPTKRSALFILFTGEEMGLLGSRYYVQHPVLPLEQMIYCFNTDGGGYNNTTLATIAGLNRTTAKDKMIEGAKTFGLKALDIDEVAPEEGLFDRSDNVSFAKVGIPAPTYSTGFDAFDDEINKYYHQAADEAESLDYDYLLKFYQGYVLSGRLISNDPERPYWIKGDKYEAAGNALYGKVPKVPIKD